MIGDRLDTDVSAVFMCRQRSPQATDNSRPSFLDPVWHQWRNSLNDGLDR